MRSRFFQYFLVFTAALALSFGWQNLSATANSAPVNTTFQQDIIAQLSTTTPCSKITQLHLPFEQAPVTAHREIPDENETEDDFEFETDTDLPQQEQNLFSAFGTTATTNLFTRSSAFIHNRTAVPLFVLYHSWKSFMS